MIYTRVTYLSRAAVHVFRSTALIQNSVHYQIMFSIRIFIENLKCAEKTRTTLQYVIIFLFQIIVYTFPFVYIL